MRAGFAAEENTSPSHAVEWEKKSAIVDKLDELESALDDLDSNIDNFDDENWRETVPTVRDAAADLRSAFEELKKQVNG